MSGNKKPTTKKTYFMKRIWDFFISLKAVIFLLLILAALSIVGTIIEQNKPLHDYYRYFQPQTVSLLKSLGLLDMYHSWWFITCLVLLAMSIVACTTDRYSSVMAGMRRKNPVLDETMEKTLHPLKKIKYALPLEYVEGKIIELTGKRFTTNPVVTEWENARHYFFEKGKYGRLGFFITHLSIIMIFTGAVVGSFAGYKGYAGIFEGDTFSRLETGLGDIKHLGFAVKCNAFDIEFYPNGTPKDYRSDLAIIKNGREVIRKTIRVNNPLTFEGVTFYQSGYGLFPGTARIEILSRDGVLKEEVSAPFGKKVDIFGGANNIEWADYQEHFLLKNGFDAGAALGINLYSGNKAATGFWLPKNYPKYDRMRRGDYYLTVKEVNLKKYTTLQINKDPGEQIVWFASVMLIAGIMIALFMPHKKLWLRLKKDKKNNVELTVGSTSNKNRAAFAGELESLVKSFEEIS